MVRESALAAFAGLRRTAWGLVASVRRPSVKPVSGGPGAFPLVRGVRGAAESARPGFQGVSLRTTAGVDLRSGSTTSPRSRAVP